MWREGEHEAYPGIQMETNSRRVYWDNLKVARRLPENPHYPNSSWMRSRYCKKTAILPLMSSAWDCLEPLQVNPWTTRCEVKTPIQPHPWLQPSLGQALVTLAWCTTEPGCHNCHFKGHSVTWGPLRLSPSWSQHGHMCLITESSAAYQLPLV